MPSVILTDNEAQAVSRALDRLSAAIESIANGRPKYEREAFRVARMATVIRGRASRRRRARS